VEVTTTIRSRRALEQAYLRDAGLNNIVLEASQTIRVARQDLLDLLESSADVAAIFAAGPPDQAMIQPHYVEALKSQGMDAVEIRRVQSFCESVGRQLFQKYLHDQERTAGWNLARWPADKVAMCAIGMHGLGMTHAFGHSVPKATLPLFWARGPVTHGSHTIVWQPLFVNA